MGPVDGCHKIGKTNNPERRRWEISLLLPVEPVIVHLIPTAAMVPAD